MSWSRGVLMALVWVLGLGYFVGVPAPAAAQQPCADVPGLTSHGDAPGDAAVVLVHGWTGSADMWRGPMDRGINRYVEGIDRSFADQIDGLDRLDAWLLDYHDVSGRWVTSADAAADRLEAAVRCLADAYGHPVGIVGHSMGGLAAREVVDRVGTGMVSAAVTLGTPHTGSDYALRAAVLLDIAPASILGSGNLVGAAVSDVLLELLWLCGQASTVAIDACGPWLDPVTAFDGEAGRALRTGSRQLADLPDWPVGQPTMAISGQVEIRAVHRTLFGLSTREREIASLGDLIVTQASATASGNEVHAHECGHLLAATPDAALLETFGYAYVPADRRSINVVGSPCAHWHYSHAIEVGNKTMSFLTEFARPSGQTVTPVPWLTLTLPEDAEGPEVADRGATMTWQTTTTGELGGEVMGGYRVAVIDRSASIYLEDRREAHDAEFGPGVFDPDWVETVPPAPGTVEGRRLTLGSGTGDSLADTFVLDLGDGRAVVLESWLGLFGEPVPPGWKDQNLAIMRSLRIAPDDLPGTESNRTDAASCFEPAGPPSGLDPVCVDSFGLALEIYASGGDLILYRRDPSGDWRSTDLAVDATDGGPCSDAVVNEATVGAPPQLREVWLQRNC